MKQKFKPITSWIRFMQESAANKQTIPEDQSEIIMHSRSETVSKLWENMGPNKGEVQILSQHPIIQGITPILKHKTKTSLRTDSIMQATAEETHKKRGNITVMKRSPRENHWNMAGREA